MDIEELSRTGAEAILREDGNPFTGLAPFQARLKAAGRRQLRSPGELIVLRPLSVGLTLTSVGDLCFPSEGANGFKYKANGLWSIRIPFVRICNPNVTSGFQIPTNRNGAKERRNSKGTLT